VFGALDCGNLFVACEIVKAKQKLACLDQRLEFDDLPLLHTKKNAYFATELTPNRATSN
jgi:hypothetical protein